MSFFESEEKKAFKGHFGNLLSLGLSDGNLDEAELDLILAICSRLGLTEGDIQAVLKNPKKWKFRSPRSIEAKLEILTDYILVMLADGVISPEEANFCNQVASQLGLDPNVVIPQIISQVTAGARAEESPDPGNVTIDSEAFLSDQGGDGSSLPAGRRSPARPGLQQDFKDAKQDEIRLGDFAVSIVEGEKIDGDYFLLDHNQNYSIGMRNYCHRCCDADIEIDGKDMGTFRVPPYAQMVVERPAHDEGKFTFYELMSKEGNSVGLKANQNLGLVRVTFRPEKEREFLLYGANPNETSNATLAMGEPPSGLGVGDDSTRLGASNPNRSAAPAETGALSNVNLPRAGGTGLAGKSDQKLENAEEIEYDAHASVVIHLRLGARVKPVDTGPRELKPHPRSNKVPPPLS